MIRCRLGRRILTAALLALLSIAGTAAAAEREAAKPQAAEPESIFSERIDVNLVNLNVVVTSYWGRPITDLTRDDFEIFEDGERRQISHFARVLDGVPDDVGEIAALPRSEGSLPGVTRPGAAATPLDRSIILAFHAGIQRPYLRRAVKAARNFVAERSADGIWWSVVMLADRPYSLVPLTDDGGQVVDTLESLLAQNAAGSRFLVPTPAVPRRATLDGPWCRLDLTEQSLAFPFAAASLSEIFRAYASVPGAKACVIYQQGRGGGWIGGVGAMMQLRQHVEMWRDLGRQATAAGFKVYAMDVLGLNLPAGIGSGNLAAMFHNVPSISVADFGPTALARATGGDFFALNHLDEAVKAAARELSTYYTLAFAAPHGHDGEAHDIVVKVPGRRWLEVRHSSGFFDVDPRTLLVEHLAAPAYFPKRGALPLRLEVAVSPPVAGELELVATAATPAEHLTLVPEDGARVAEIDVFVALHDATGALVSLEQDRWRVKVSATAAEVKFAVPLRLRQPAAGHTVSVALHDPVSGLSGIASQAIGGRQAGLDG